MITSHVDALIDAWISGETFDFVADFARPLPQRTMASVLGFPLEDVPLGKGAHWEARVAGSELMSYGSNTGQTYISDLTLAYLEDTNHFFANYSNAGFIVTSTYNAGALLDTSQAVAFLGTDGSPYTPPAPFAPPWTQTATATAPGPARPRAKLAAMVRQQLPTKSPTISASGTAAPALLQIPSTRSAATSPTPRLLSRMDGKHWSTSKTRECGQRLTQGRKLSRWPLDVQIGANL
jgi:hypothetical protein